MDPVVSKISISRPREEVYDYLVDIANHAEFTDHFLTEWRLTRIDTVGEGAGARFRVDAPLNRFPWADATLSECSRPHRIVETGRTGKFNRIRTRQIWELDEQGGGATRVRLVVATEPALPSDRFLELFAGRGWARRRFGRGLRRLAAILEEGRDRGRRVTVAGASACAG